MRREEIAARVDALAREHEGKEFVAAVEELSGVLDQEDRDVLGEILLERAQVLESAAVERARAKGWMRRTFDVDAHLRGRGPGGSNR